MKMTINSGLLTVLLLYASQLDTKLQQGIITYLFNGLKNKMFIFKAISKPLSSSDRGYFKWVQEFYMWTKAKCTAGLFCISSVPISDYAAVREQRKLLQPALGKTSYLALIKLIYKVSLWILMSQFEHFLCRGQLEINSYRELAGLEINACIFYTGSYIFLKILKGFIATLRRVV